MESGTGSKRCGREQIAALELSALVLLVLLVLIVALAGCSSAPPRQTELMQSVEGVEISTREMQVRLYAYASDFAAKVERAADEIYRATDDPEIRVNALAWKIHAIPAMHNQIFVEDPLVGAVNAYALCRQMTFLFAPGEAGADVFGDQQAIARAAADSVEQAVVDLLRLAKSDGDISEIQGLVNDFAVEFPLDGLNFARRSSNGFMAPALAGGSVGGLAAAAAMNEQLRVFNDRLAIYAESVPKQLRWQTELAMAQFPPFADEQREAAILAAREEAIAAWTVVARMIEEMRQQTMRDFGQERVAVMGGITGEREAILDALAHERQILLDALEANRAEVFQAIDAIVNATLETMGSQTRTTTTGAIDQAIAGAKVLMIWTFCGVVLIIAVAWFAARNLINHARKKPHA